MLGFTPDSHLSTHAQGDVAWFLNGKLNASVCCVDQHLPEREDQVAIIWEGDEPGDCKRITYKVCPASFIFQRERKNTPWGFIHHP